MRKISSLVLAAILGLTAVVQADRPNDLVKSIPNCGDSLPTKWYSGYLDVSETKSLHYVFVTSASDQAATDPVVVWFNGGPGCSSLLALFAEHGPYVFDDGEFVIKQNPEPWNKRANVLYIESPAGVGYSYAKTDEDTQHNDLSSSMDSFEAIKIFFTDFKEYLKNPLFISGESYAGIYVPYLSWQIHQYNLQADWSNDETITKYNLKGFIVGNGATDWDLDIYPAYPEVLYNFNMIDKDLLANFKQSDCHYYFNDVKKYPNKPECAAMWKTIQDARGNLNWYDLFRTEVPKGPILQAVNREGSVMIDGVEKTYTRGFTMQEYTPWAKHLLTDTPHVLGQSLSDYVNSQGLRDAFHIPSNLKGWNQCANGNSFTYHYQYEGSVWIYPILKAYNYQILVFSGDTDGAVPTLGTRRWIQNQNWEITKPWRPWVTDQQTSGYIIDYDNVKFATIHGAGHLAPQWKRKEANKLFTSFIHGEDIV
ncbi:carboxypeptidase c (cathepsin a) [Stylonychia lemnae]|uniref:Carboxypeptidase n=1 Tax=Stylonychia lemnae TaxID=5949 RepID=A0A078AWM4_STYLE|nr:carboxypeptidase c (cathepsin a) [Stylonychia lemnae]|eukprot:CDW86436.1 carboxypeptidase c (cathepsin a) [Stylonychia lemnae]